MPDWTVTVGGETFGLSKPVDVAAVWDCANLARTNANRAASMALALCWPVQQPRRPRVRYSDPHVAYDAGCFGGLVFADLVERGANPGEVMAAGTVALRLVNTCIPGKKAQASAEDFTAADGGT